MAWGGGSLTARMLWRLVLPVAALALVLGIVGAVAITRTVGAVNDRILSAASRGIADSLATDGSEITLDLSPAIFGMLKNNARDNVYYSVRVGRRVLTGYDDLPQVTPDPTDRDGFTFADDRYLGRDIRIVAVAQSVPQIREPVIVQVAETLDARRRMARSLLVGLAALELTLILMAAMLMPLAVRRGLSPLGRLRAEMDRRGAEDLTPLSTSDVPSELGDLVRAFNTMLTRLDKGIAGIRRFTADASHQMRTPLSILRTHVAVLMRARPGSAEATSSIADIDDAGRKLSHLLGQLLSLARADGTQPARIIHDATDLNALARHVADDYAPAARDRGVRLLFAPPADAVMARTEATLATELLANILDNAIRYTPPGRAVRIAVEHTPPALRVDDEGPGIAAKDRQRVFGRFVRLDPGANPGGSGLGLAIAGSIATMLDLDLHMDDGPDGRGLSVRIVFPPMADSLVTAS